MAARPREWRAPDEAQLRSGVDGKVVVRSEPGAPAAQGGDVAVHRVVRACLLVLHEAAVAHERNGREVGQGDGAPLLPGWSFSSLVVLPNPVSSWTYVLDNRRVTSTNSSTSTGVTQLQEALPRLVARWGRPILLLDRRYSNAPWVVASAKLATEQMVRARGDQVVYRPPPPPSGKRGRPRKDGARFKGTDASTHGPPDTTWTGHDAVGKPVAVQVWQGLHLRKAREVPLRVIQISRPAAVGSKRDPRVGWFWWLGEQCPAAEELAGLYGRRFGQENG